MTSTSTSVPQDFIDLLPKIALKHEEGPLYWLWVFDPDSGDVHVEHNHGRHRAHTLDHEDMAKKVANPDRVHGYAYKIQGGYRITTADHKAVDDPFIVKQVTKRLNGDSSKVSQYQINGKPDFARTHYGMPLAQRG